MMYFILFVLAAIFFGIILIYLESVLLSDIRERNYKRICIIGLTMSLLSALCIGIAIWFGLSDFILAYTDFGASMAILYIGLAVYDKNK